MLRRELDELHEDYTKVYDANARLRKNLAQKDEVSKRLFFFSFFMFKWTDDFAETQFTRFDQ